MVKTKPTLFDLLLDLKAMRKNRSSVDQIVNARLVSSVKDARVFLIDDDTMYTADKMRTPLMMDPKLSLPDVALPPYDVTWVEYNPHSFLEKRFLRKEDFVPDRVGHLFLRGDVGAADDGTGPDGWVIVTVEEFNRQAYVCPFSMTWTKDPKHIAPVRHFVGSDFKKELKEPFFRQAMLDGTVDPILPAWHERFGGDIYQGPPSSRAEAQDTAQRMYKLINFHAGAGSRVMSLLAMMAHCPTTTRTLAPAGRWMSRQSGVHSRPFTKHTSVRIEMGERLAYKTVRKAGMEAQRRAQHEVRAHFRTIRKGKPDEYRVQIKSHTRGDPNIGVIVHDTYETVRVRRY
jgi:hypothetical protein